MYDIYVTKIKNIRPHPNADRLNIGEAFGNGVVIDKSTTETDLYLYLPTDGQISIEYGEANNLFRKKDENGNNVGGFIDPDKRNIRAIKLRGERSDGLVMPLASLTKFGDITKLCEGDIVTVFNGHEIATKYIPVVKESQINIPKMKGKVRDKVAYPFFAEHIDTPQLRFNLQMFKTGDIISLTEKVHGTSTRNAYTVCVSYKKNFFDRLLRRKGKEVKEYKYVVGTRRTTLQNNNNGFYGSNKFRTDWADKINGKLHKGETVYGEIAGFFAPNSPIMARADNKKTLDKDFIKTFGDSTTFSYGCNEGAGQSRFFIYRMTFTSDEGYVIEYSWDLVRLRAEQMGFEVVPELDRFIYTTEEDFLNHIARFIDIPSTIDSSHIIEGVVIRALNAPGLRVAKEKSFNFKVIENIIKVEADAPDMEEIEDMLCSPCLTQMEPRELMKK